jgi:hypothetical protein
VHNLILLFAAKHIIERDGIFAVLVLLFLEGGNECILGMYIHRYVSTKSVDSEKYVCR